MNRTYKIETIAGSRTWSAMPIRLRWRHRPRGFPMAIPKTVTPKPSA